MTFDSRAIYIQADGSCYLNPGGESGCAAVVHFPDHLSRPDQQIVDFGCAESSINRMELMACIEGLKWVCCNAPWDGVARVVIVTDSLYVTENVVRARGWKKLDWRNRYGEPKFNEDLWDKLLKSQIKAARLGIRIDFKWEKGKKTPIAKQADKAAEIAAKRGGIEVDTGRRPGSVSHSMVKGGSAQRFPAAGQVIVIRPYAKKIMHKGENRISFHIYDETTQSYVGKFYAFADPVLGAEVHNGNGHRVRFNTDLNYPRLMERIEGVTLPKPPPKRRKSAKKTFGSSECSRGSLSPTIE